MLVQLRNYQTEAIENIRAAYRNGSRAVLLVLSTGSGKTVVFCNIAERTAKKNHSAYTLVHRQELLRQTSEHLDRLGVNHGLIAPGHSMTGDPVQVASVQTLVRRLDRGTEPNLIIIDEAHHSVAGTWKKILQRWPNSLILGVTATPIRMDGKGLGKSVGGCFDTMIEGPSIRELIDSGYLSQPIVFAPPTDINLNGIRTNNGDYEQRELAIRVDKPTITGSAVEHYLRLCPGAPAIAFCASVKHAEHVAEQFNAVGIAAASLTGEMTDSVRKHRVASLGNGQIKILTSCDIVSEGTDIPIVTTAILLRPTKSLGLFLQQCGRVLRPFPGKKNAIILDHAGNCLRHGLPDDVREWSLDAGIVKKKSNKKASVQPCRRCKQCFAVFGMSAPKCPQCGLVVTAEEREIKQVSGELHEITREHIARLRLRREEGMATSLESLLGIARSRGYDPAWAHIRYNARKARQFKENMQQMRMAI